MAKQRAKITFVVELNSLEIIVPNQKAGEDFVKKLNVGLRGAVRKALNLPKTAKLSDSFSGAITGRVEGNEDAGFVLSEFGEGSADENEDGEDESEDDEHSLNENDQGKSQETPSEDGDLSEDTKADEPSVSLDSDEFRESEEAKANQESWEKGPSKPRRKIRKRSTVE